MRQLKRRLRRSLKICNEQHNAFQDSTNRNRFQFIDGRIASERRCSPLRGDLFSNARDDKSGRLPWAQVVHGFFGDLRQLRGDWRAGRNGGIR